MRNPKFPKRLGRKSVRADRQFEEITIITTSLPVLDSHTPPARVMALHALAYCPRLFYLEEVEEIRVADDRLFAGRDLHASLAADEEGETLSLELASETLGLLGKVDCIKQPDWPDQPPSHVVV
jgi:CRISP-associated protein Cas1